MRLADWTSNASHLIQDNSKERSRRTLSTLCVSVSSTLLVDLTIRTWRAWFTLVVQDWQVWSFFTRTSRIVSWVTRTKLDTILRTFGTLLADLVWWQCLILSTSCCLSVIQSKSSISTLMIRWRWWRSQIIKRFQVILVNDVTQLLLIRWSTCSPFDKTV